MAWKRAVLTPAEMAEVDRRAIAEGPFSGIELMQHAGQAVVAALLDRFPAARTIHVLCGPGNNGGDGYVVAELLRQSGLAVAVYGEGPPRKGSDAAIAAGRCQVWPQPLAAFQPQPGDLVVDALFGAGLERPLGEQPKRAVALARSMRLPVVAVDLPSGLSGETGQVLGDAFRAALTVTFVRKKPGHLLWPGRGLCGELVVADIGIADAVVGGISPACSENGPDLWREALPRPDAETHKYARGHVAVFSGGATATGAARLSAMAAARIGAGAVTVLSPPDALAANAAHLTSIMLRGIEGIEEAAAFADDRRVAAIVYGPGLSPEPATGSDLMRLLDGLAHAPPVVVDASALTSLAEQPDLLAPPFGGRASELVLTPHEGEFRRLFPDISEKTVPSKLERARQAAKRTQATVVYKGPDTVIAAPDGRAAINSNGTPLLATAGSGDVLAGLIGGLLAQKMQAFEAASAAVWIHSEAAVRFGPGLIAEDLSTSILPVVKELLAD